MRAIHPFPARMAPEIALKAISDLPSGAKVLDPMTGSGTVLREAVMQGHDAYGYDLDPLAVLISNVWTRKIDLEKLEKKFDRLITNASNARLSDIELPWIDKDKETREFIDFWFSNPQKRDLKKIAYFLHKYEKQGKDREIVDALKLALSRIIITKKVGASLAWDISHSRPHKVREENDYDVFAGYKSSVEKLVKQLSFEGKEIGKANVSLGDARFLDSIKDKSIDAVITSPPYLNAIDYLRGHKFSLVWFGYTIPEIRGIRSISVGAEKAKEKCKNDDIIKEIREEIVTEESLPKRQIKMIERYIGDAIGLMSEVSRVLNKKGKAVFVVGNSCLQGTYIENSKIFERAGSIFDLNLIDSQKRELPENRRYLPIPKGKKESLGKRMRYEIVQTFAN